MTIFDLMMNGVFVSRHVSKDFAVKAKAAYDAVNGLESYESYVVERVMATQGTKPFASSKIVA